MLEVHEAFEAIAGLSGPGSQAARAEAVAALFGRATADEQRWLRGLATGEVRQGALDALVQEAVAAAAEIPPREVRRAAMLAGSTVAVVRTAFEGGEPALAEIGLEVGRPVLPMLASSAKTLAEAVEKAGGGTVAVDTKLDGIRIQVHRLGDRVVVATRSLDDITARLPEVVEPGALAPVGALRAGRRGDRARRRRPAAGLPGDRVPHRAERRRPGHPVFFDVLHVDGRDLLTAPGDERLAALERLVPQPFRVLGSSPPTWRSRRRSSPTPWPPVTRASSSSASPRRTTPAAAAPRGSRSSRCTPSTSSCSPSSGARARAGTLSNMHLGARDPSAETGFVMLGKTFKGMTDELLAWQTERFLGLETHRDGHVVHVHPEQVVEIAFDGLQRSTRYPGGLALRFARVGRYRDDKTAAEADTMETVRALA